MKDYIKANIISFSGFIPFFLSLLFFLSPFAIEATSLTGRLFYGVMFLSTLIFGIGVICKHPRARHYHKQLLKFQHDFDDNYRYEPEVAA